MSSAGGSARSRAEDLVSIRVLVVSPNSRLRSELCEKLDPPRWKIIETSSGAEALEFLHGRQQPKSCFRSNASGRWNW